MQNAEQHRHSEKQQCHKNYGHQKQHTNCKGNPELSVLEKYRCPREIQDKLQAKQRRCENLFKTQWREIKNNKRNKHQ